MLPIGLLVAVVAMFNLVNGQLDAMNKRIEAIQAEMNRRFDQLFEMLRIFEGRLTHLEERIGINRNTAASRCNGLGIA